MREIDRRLLNCAKNGNLDGVVSVLNADADINIQNKEGRAELSKYTKQKNITGKI